MSLNRTDLTRTDATPTRIAAAASVLFGIAFFVTVASVNVPHDASDADLLAWWQDDGKVTSGMASMAFAMLTAVLFSVVTNHVLVSAGDRSPRLVAFTRTMATAFTTSLLVSGALRGVIGHLVKVQDEPLPGIDVLRYTTALNYTVLGIVVMTCFALTVLTLGALVLRLGLLARWQGFVGLGCGAVTMLAVAALLGAFTVPIAILWAICTAVAVLRAPETGATHEAPQPVGTMAA